MNKKKFYLWLSLSVLWVGFIIGQSAMPASVSSKESLGLLARLQELFPWLTHDLLRKLAHFGEFGILGFFLTGTYWNRGKFKFLQPVRAAFFAAFCDETLQLFIPGRSGQIKDVWIDFAGALCGCLFLWLILKLTKNNNKRLL